MSKTKTVTKPMPRRPPPLGPSLNFIKSGQSVHGGAETPNKAPSELESSAVSPMATTVPTAPATGSGGKPKRKLVKRKRTNEDVWPVTVYLPPDWEKPLGHAAVNHGMDLTGIIVHAVGLFLGKR